MNTNDIQNSQEILDAKSETTPKPQTGTQRTLPELQAYACRCIILWSVFHLYLIAIAIGISSLFMFKPWHRDEEGPVMTCVIITLCLIVVARYIQGCLGRRDK